MGVKFLRNIILGIALVSTSVAEASDIVSTTAAKPVKEKQEYLLQLFPLMASIVIGKRVNLMPVTSFASVTKKYNTEKICGDIPGVRDSFVTYFNDNPLRFINDKPDFEPAGESLRDKLREDFDTKEILTVRFVQGALREGIDFPHATIFGCGIEGKENKKGGEKKKGDAKPKKH